MPCLAGEMALPLGSPSSPGPLRVKESFADFQGKNLRSPGNHSRFAALRLDWAAGNSGNRPC
jgi:hypothetical protein